MNAIVQLILNAQLVGHMDMKAMFLFAHVCPHQFAQIALWEEF